MIRGREKRDRSIFEFVSWRLKGIDPEFVMPPVSRGVSHHKHPETMSIVEVSV